MLFEYMYSRARDMAFNILFSIERQNQLILFLSTLLGFIKIFTPI